MEKAAGKKPVKLLQKQPVMRRVLLALVPCICGAIYYFGWYCLFVIALANITGFTVEFIFTRRRNKPVTEAVFVTSTLFALVMPPTVPW
ncbi:MAG: RnfABCDGE type electron transport complex subunit D, partial [Phycisphaerae bacterium]